MIKKIYTYMLLKNVPEAFGEGRHGIDLPSELNVEQKPLFVVKEWTTDLAPVLRYVKYSYQLR